MGFWDSTQGSSDGGGRPSWWDSSLDHAGPFARSYTVVRLVLYGALVITAVALLTWWVLG